MKVTRAGRAAAHVKPRQAHWAGPVLEVAFAMPFQQGKAMYGLPEFDRLERALDEALAAFRDTERVPREAVHRQVKALHSMLKRLRTNANSLRDELGPRRKF